MTTLPTMTTDEESQLARELIRILGCAASYNDKGFVWRRHSTDQQIAMRARLQSELSDLARRIGENALGPTLSEAIATGAAVTDDSGEFVFLARAHFGIDP